ncbi:hypothetical protein FXO37_30864 [Capsicum annuum]|nr:hypothetical protein FXO37_30864 [Capsicum annuum]
MDIDQFSQQSSPLHAVNTSSVTLSFAQKVLQSDLFPNLIGSPVTKGLEDEITPENCEGNFIPISIEDKSRLYSPWQTSLIAKLMGRKLGYLRWEPKFVASQARLAHTAIWVHLHELPTEFYDVDILHKVGAKIGTLLKIDTCTSTTSRGSHKQVIRYEAASLLCTACGRLRHTTRCPYKIPSNNHSNDKRSDDPLHFPKTTNHQKQRTEDDERWQLVSFLSKQQCRFTDKGKQIAQQSGKSPVGPIRINEGMDTLRVKSPHFSSFPQGPSKSPKNSTSKYFNYPNRSFNDNEQRVEFNVGPTELPDLELPTPNIPNSQTLTAAFTNNMTSAPSQISMQISADKTHVDTLHGNLISSHVSIAHNSPKVYPLNDYASHRNKKLLSAQPSPSPTLSAQLHISELLHNTATSIKDGSFSKLPVQGPAHPSQSSISITKNLPILSTDGTRERQPLISNIHLDESNLSLHSPVMAGGGFNGSRPLFHHECERAGLSYSDSKSSGSSPNHNRGNDVRNESVQRSTSYESIPSDPPVLPTATTGGGFSAMNPAPCDGSSDGSRSPTTTVVAFKHGRRREGNNIYFSRSGTDLSAQRTVWKKISVKCPQNMFKCWVHVRPTLNPDVGKYAIIMSPYLRDTDLSDVSP